MSSHKSLAGLRVLITRPERQLEPITDTLRQLDGMVFHFSLIEIEKIKSATRIAVIKQKVERLENYDKLIFVSSNAAKYGAEWIKRHWTKVPTECEIIAIGPSTAKIASDLLGCEVIFPQLGSSSEDLVSLPSLLDVAHKNIAIFRGTGGREFLASRLIESGAEVDYLEVYSRSPTVQSSQQLLKTITDDRINVLTITSGDSLEVMNKMFLESKEHCARLFSIPLIVPSVRLRALAETFGFRLIKLAQGAGVEATVSALQEVALEADKLNSN